jgi:hypothetical protein
VVEQAESVSKILFDLTKNIKNLSLEEFSASSMLNCSK